MTREHERTSRSVYYICPEVKFGQGCDLAEIVDRDDVHVVRLIEIKSCYLDVKDVNKAVEQFNFTENKLREQVEQVGKRLIIAERLILHDKRGKCGVSLQASTILESLSKRRIRLVPVEKNDPVTCRLLNIYYDKCVRGKSSSA